VPPAKPNCLLLGRLQRDTIITADGRARIDQPGGNLLYATAACRLWGANPGLIARVGSDYPAAWIEDLAAGGLDMRGLRVLDAPQDQRRFIAYKEIDKPRFDQPVKHFANLGLPFPKSLLGYQPPNQTLDSKRERAALTLRKEDIPEIFRDVETAHLCPLDFLSHSLIPAALRDLGATQITMEAGGNYMHPKFWDELPELVNGLTLFVVRDEQLRGLFSERSEDLWEMAEMLTSFNCRAVLIRSAARGQWLYNSETQRKLHLPAFPSRRYDITDKGSSLCGGLLAGLVQSQDLQRAFLVGSAIASLSVEGSGPFYVTDTLPGLVESRIESLQAALKIL
jgi:sugar/nucleoside kinase (ribokinase family)